MRRCESRVQWTARHPQNSASACVSCLKRWLLWHSPRVTLHFQDSLCIHSFFQNSNGGLLLQTSYQKRAHTAIS